MEKYMIFWQVLLTALLVEALITTLKPIYDKKKGWQIDRLFSLLLGAGLCILIGVDLFALVGLSLKVPYVGSILTGILISRGSNSTHDLIKVVEVLRETLQGRLIKLHK
jgi:hypothetical protein